MSKVARDESASEASRRGPWPGSLRLPTLASFADTFITKIISYFTYFPALECIKCVLVSISAEIKDCC